LCYIFKWDFCSWE